MVGRTTVSSSGSTGSESFVLIWVHFLNSVGCRFNNQWRGLFRGGVRHQRTPPGHRGHARLRRPARRAPWPSTCGFWLAAHLERPADGGRGAGVTTFGLWPAPAVMAARVGRRDFTISILLTFA